MKKPLRQTDYLIIGQGLAGTLLAHELEKNGHEFIVFDPNVGNASKTAAGMYNPVVLKRFSPVWQGGQQIAAAKQVMAELSKKLAVTLDYPLDIFRVFHDETEKITWTKKAATRELQGLLDAVFYRLENDDIIAPFGLGRVVLGGKVDLKTLLSRYRLYLQQQHCIYTERIDYQRFSRSRQQWIYHGETVTIVANKVVCCEGYGIKQNPYFNDLPLKGNKGEVLLIKAPQLNLAAAIKSKVFIMPMPERGEDIYFVGATYNWTDKDSLPSEAAKQTLLAKLAQFVRGDIQVLSQHAGIRPTVLDRRPLLGEHHEQKQFYIFNGLGTRGVMLGASMVKLLYQLIEHQINLPTEVDIKRFLAK